MYLPFCLFKGISEKEHWCCRFIKDCVQIGQYKSRPHARSRPCGAPASCLNKISRSAGETANNCSYALEKHQATRYIYIYIYVHDSTKQVWNAHEDWEKNILATGVHESTSVRDWRRHSQRDMSPERERGYLSHKTLWRISGSALRLFGDLMNGRGSCFN